MAKAFSRNLRFSALQFLFNQGLAFVLFLFLSGHLDKEEFGIFNWALALLLIIFSILSFGMDQLLVKKIAAGENPSLLLPVFWLHSFLGGLLFLVVLSLLSFTGIFTAHSILPWLACGKFFLSLSLPFKSMANGREEFRSLLWMSTTANFVKAAGLIVLAALGILSLRNAVLVFVIGDSAEFLLSLLLARTQLVQAWRTGFHVANYLPFMRAALPQFGVVVFSMALSRMDHVLLGLFDQASSVAEYSVASRVTEMAGFPLLIIGPLLLPFLSRSFAKQEDQSLQLQTLLRFEIVLACFTMFALNLCWTPVMDTLTAHRYGSPAETTVLILSATIPLLYFNNVLWTLLFSAGRTKSVLWVFAGSFLINLAGNLLLIPAYGAVGAAAVYAISIFYQSLAYTRKTGFVPAPRLLFLLMACSLLTTGIILIAKKAAAPALPTAIAGALVFVALLAGSGLMKKHDLAFLQKKLGRS